MLDVLRVVILKPTRMSFNKVLYFNLLSNVNDNEGSSQKIRTT